MADEQIIVLQTADAVRYSRMMAATSRTAVEFCRRHGHRYESYTGIKRGVHGWQATFNRIYQLAEIIGRGHRGWALYMDADAYIHDLDFDLRAYLSDKADRAGVFSTIADATSYWSINAGVLMLNCGHPLGREIVDRWMEAYHKLDDAWLVRETRVKDWDNDQSMLFDIFDRDITIRDAAYYESHTLMNVSDSRFIRQYLTAYTTNLDDRTAIIEQLTNEVLDVPSSDRVEAEQIVAALYQAILKRAPDPAGLAPYAALVRSAGPAAGTRRVAEELIASPEYRALIAG